MSVTTLIVTSLKTYTLTPADLLPAQGTIALFSFADDALLRQYAPWLPILKDLPHAEIPRTVAVVDTPQTGKVLIVFARRPVIADALPSGPLWAQREVGPLLVAASSPEIFTDLDASANSIGSSQAFTLLSRSATEGQPWIFIDRFLLPHSDSLTDVITENIFLRDATHLGILPRIGSGMVIRVFPANTQRRSLPLPPVINNSTFSLALARPESAFGDLYATLSTDRQAMLDTNILTFFASSFGDDVSFTYDFLPLLMRPARFSIAHNASGSTVLLMQGSASDAADRITHLHEVFRGSKTIARTVTRVFEKGRYTFRNVRDDEHMLTDEEASVSGMQLRKTMHAIQGEFCSAVQGEEFMMATDCEALERAILERPQEPGTSAIATGTLTRGILSAIPSLLSPTSPLASSAPDSLEWALSRQGDILTLTIFPRR
ncbi:hypothetical protein AUJ46_05720 [Candidatus Peregrinibacteria bacterium CG1_02_54_53]|nr:MAG: hypothetical protein AUJ46_05720 [Candidatus Peregrinibacteria bacterium CG1_02_54_53]